MFIKKYCYLDEWLGSDFSAFHIEMKDICDHSSLVEPGDIFIDVCRDLIESKKHIRCAVANGAVAVLSANVHELSLDIPIIFVNSLRESLSYLAADFYDNPSHNVQCIGITGTNGKTTTAVLIMSALTNMGVKCGYIGTLGYGDDVNNMKDLFMTTPSAVRVQRIMSEMVCSGMNVIVMEVSSHALSQNRVLACVFDLVLFTNLTRDHLDYHQSMFDYAQSKKKLFTIHNTNSIILNADDPVGERWSREINNNCLIPITFDANKHINDKDVHCSIIYSDMRGTFLVLDTPWGKIDLHSSLIGSYNAYNLSQAALALIVLGYDLEKIAHAVSLVKSIPGRLDFYRSGHHKPTVVIDYAHTPSALEEVLKSLRSLTNHRIWVVFGCGGNRDVGKRSLMGQVVERLADRVILTNDNPRDEDPEKIVSEILRGMVCPWAVEIEFDRARAINRAVQEAKFGDIVLIAGKGHENFQSVKGKRISFNDKTHVLNALGMKEHSIC